MRDVCEYRAWFSFFFVEAAIITINYQLGNKKCDKMKNGYIRLKMKTNNLIPANLVEAF
jgi:hypothetical protein